MWSKDDSQACVYIGEPLSSSPPSLFGQRWPPLEYGIFLLVPFSEEQWAHKSNGSCSFVDQPWAQLHGFRSTWILDVWLWGNHSNPLSICFALCHNRVDMTMPPFQNIVCLQWVHMCRALDQDNLKHTIEPSHSPLSSLPALVEGASDAGEEDESCWLAPGNWQRFLDFGFRKSLAVRVVWLVKVDMESMSVGNRRQITKVGR